MGLNSHFFEITFRVKTKLKKTDDIDDFDSYYNLFVQHCKIAS